MIDLRASALAGFVLIMVVIGAWLYEIATGQDGQPYSQLGAVAGVAYVLRSPSAARAASAARRPAGTSAGPATGSAASPPRPR